MRKASVSVVPTAASLVSHLCFPFPFRCRGGAASRAFAPVAFRERAASPNQRDVIGRRVAATASARGQSGTCWRAQGAVSVHDQDVGEVCLELLHEGERDARSRRGGGCLLGCPRTRFLLCSTPGTTTGTTIRRAASLSSIVSVSVGFPSSVRAFVL